MTENDLRALGAAFQLSPTAADLVIDAMLQREPDCAEQVHGGGKTAYKVKCVGGSTSVSKDALLRVADLLALSGSGRTVHKLRKLHERQPPADRNRLVPSERWVVMAEADSTATPDIQAQACLRLLQPVSQLNTQVWVRDIARQRLSALLAEYPGLMHPRLVWSYESDRNLIGEPLPMAQSIAATPYATFPSPFQGLSHAQVKAFATHPVVGFAFRAASPVLERVKSRGTKVMLQGKTLMGHMAGGTTSKLSVAHALLLIERLRQESHCGVRLFGGTKASAAGIETVLTNAFKGAWSLRPAVVSESGPAFLEELARSQVHPARNLRLLREVGHVFIDILAGRVQVAPDPLDRYERLVHALVTVKAIASSKEAERSVMRAMLPLKGEEGKITSAPGHADVNVANALMTRWLTCGVTLEELGARVRHTQGSSSWGQVLEILENVKVMRDVIAAHPAAPTTVDEPVQAPARRSARRAL